MNGISGHYGPLNGGDPNPSAGFLARLEGFRISDRQRDEMVAQLVGEYEQLQKQFQRLSDDFANETESRRMWQNKAGVNARELNELKHTTESSPLVYVLIDGDGAYFRDDLIAKGDDGGAEAAHQLLVEIKKSIKESHPGANVEDWSIIVQIVMNVDGLSRKLHSCGIVKSPQEFSTFTRAFARNQPLFSVVDVGFGKEQADHKIREMFRLMVRVSQCKHIFFGPCHDNGYLPSLVPFKHDPVIGSKLTLIEATPAEPGFVALGFKMTSFPSVFRTEPLPPSKPVVPRAASIPTEPPVLAIPSKITNTAPVTSPSESTASSNWATVGKGAGSKVIDIAPKKPQAQRFYVVNFRDERLDMDLPKLDPVGEKRLSDRMRNHGKLCNRYHLTRQCEMGDQCDYGHGEKLTGTELLALKHKARSILCTKLSDCTTADCPYGHVCRYGTNCTANYCRFHDTHHVDKRPATRVYEDGTREDISA